MLHSSLDTTTKHSIAMHWLNYCHHQLGKEMESFVNNKLIAPRKEKVKVYLKNIDGGMTANFQKQRI